MPKVPEYNLPKFPPIPKRGGGKHGSHVRAYWKPKDHKRALRAKEKMKDKKLFNQMYDQDQHLRQIGLEE